MPIYEYQCGACGFSFERLTFKASDSGIVKCPDCNETQAQRVMSTCSTFGSSTSSSSERSSAPVCSPFS